MVVTLLDEEKKNTDSKERHLINPVWIFYTQVKELFKVEFVYWTQPRKKRPKCLFQLVLGI